MNWLLVFVTCIQFSVGVMGFFSSIMNPFSMKFLSRIISPFSEQCDSRWVTININGLEEDLSNHVFGQHIALEVILSALQSHLTKNYHKKPLVLNFHGWPGGGKGYVSEFIVRHWFKRGQESRYVKSYKAMLDFPEASHSKVYEYQRRLQKELEETIYRCPRSMFVFDEVDKYPPHVLDGIKPYLDYNINVNGYSFREAIFIFITNTGEKLITNIALQKWREGVPREDLQLRDFEEELKTTSFNDEGGFYKSDLIRHHLIDHVVPFLPLEKEHVESCIRAEFKLQTGYSMVPENVINEIMEEITFQPPGIELYASHGCKQIHEKVSTLLERERRKQRKNDEF